MGIKSTYDIDRQTALAVIVSKVYGCTNEQLASMLLDFEESYFRNYSVYDELPEVDEDEQCFDRVIRSVDDFNNGV
jgi:hypothetical protein